MMNKENNTSFFIFSSICVMHIDSYLHTNEKTKKIEIETGDKNEVKRLHISCTGKRTLNCKIFKTLTRKHTQFEMFV